MENNQSQGAEEKKKFIVGKAINVNDYKISCKGCRSKFNNFVRYCLTPDSIKWDCHNCDSEFTMYAQDFEESEISTSVKIIVFHKRHGEIKHKEYGLINNSQFKELIGN